MLLFTIPIHEHGTPGEPDYPHPLGGGASAAQIDTSDLTGRDVHRVFRGKAVPPVEDLAETLTKGDDVPWFGVVIRPVNEPGKSYGIEFILGGMGALGNTSFVREREGEGDLRAELGLVWLEAGKRGQGAAKPILRNYLAAWEQAKVTRVELDAVDLGSYAWLRYGFVPKNRPQFIKAVRERLESLKNLRPAVVRYIEDALGDIDAGDAKAAWRLSDLRDGKRKVGIELLREVAWRGTMDLTDTEQRTRLTHYIGV